jgi:hypothetical protein
VRVPAGVMGTPAPFKPIAADGSTNYTHPWVPSPWICSSAGVRLSVVESVVPSISDLWGQAPLSRRRQYNPLKHCECKHTALIMMLILDVIIGDKISIKSFIWQPSLFMWQFVKKGPCNVILENLRAYQWGLQNSSCATSEMAVMLCFII